MSKKKVLICSLIVIAIVSILIFIFNLRRPNERILTTDEIMQNEQIAAFIDVNEEEIPEELTNYEEIDLRKISFKDSLSSILYDQRVIDFNTNQDNYYNEIVEELIEKEDINNIVNTIIECEVENDILSICEKYRITYSNGKVLEYINTLNILVKEDDIRVLSNTELIENCELGTSFDMAQQIFDVLVKAWDYTNLKDLEYGIFCNDLHFGILRDRYVFRISDKFDDLHIAISNGRVSYNYLLKDAFNLLNVEESKEKSEKSYQRLYLKNVEKYKVPEIITYEADRFKFTDAYLNKVYDLVDQHFVAPSYEPLDFLSEEEVDISSFALEDECLCLNEDFVAPIKLVRVLFKGMPADTFKEFALNQEKTFRNFFEAVRDDSAARKLSIDGLYIKSSEFGPYDTRISAIIEKDVLSLYTKNVIPSQIGDEEVLNTLFVNVTDGSKLTNTQAIELMEFDKDKVIDQITALVRKFNFENIDDDKIKEVLNNHFDEMILNFENGKLYFNYKFDTIYFWFEIPVNKGGQLTYSTLEISK